MANKIEYWLTGRAHNASDSRDGIEVNLRLKDKRGLLEFLNGLMWISPEIRILEARCNICDKNILDCNHISGAIYDGIQAIPIVEKHEYLGAAMTSNPRDFTCYIKYIIIKDNNYSPPITIIVEVIPLPENQRLEYLINNRKIITEKELKSGRVKIITTNQVYGYYFGNNLKHYL